MNQTISRALCQYQLSLDSGTVQPACSILVKPGQVVKLSTVQQDNAALTVSVFPSQTNQKPMALPVWLAVESHVPSLTLAQHPDPECATQEFREIENPYRRKTAGESIQLALLHKFHPWQQGLGLACNPGAAIHKGLSTIKIKSLLNIVECCCHCQLSLPMLSSNSLKQTYFGLKRSLFALWPEAKCFGSFQQNLLFFSSPLWCKLLPNKNSSRNEL